MLKLRNINGSPNIIRAIVKSKEDEMDSTNETLKTEICTGVWLWKLKGRTIWKV